MSRMTREQWRRWSWTTKHPGSKSPGLPIAVRRAKRKAARAARRAHRGA